MKPRNWWLAGLLRSSSPPVAAYADDPPAGRAGAKPSVARTHYLLHRAGDQAPWSLERPGRGRPSGPTGPAGPTAIGGWPSTMTEITADASAPLGDQFLERASDCVDLE